MGPRDARTVLVRRMRVVTEGLAKFRGSLGDAPNRGLRPLRSGVIARILATLHPGAMCIVRIVPRRSATPLRSVVSVWPGCLRSSALFLISTPRLRVYPQLDRSRIVVRFRHQRERSSSDDDLWLMWSRPSRRIPLL